MIKTFQPLGSPTLSPDVKVIPTPIRAPTIGNEMATESVRIFNPKTGEQASYLITSDASLGMKEIREFALPVNMNMADLQNNPAVVRNLVVSQNQASALVNSELVDKRKIGDKSKFSVVSYWDKDNGGRIVSLVRTTLDSQAAWLVNGEDQSLWGVRLPPGAEISYEKGNLVTGYQNQKIRYDRTANKWKDDKNEIVYPPAVMINNPLGGEQNLTALLTPETSLANAKRFYNTENPLGPLGGTIIKPEDASYVSRTDPNKTGRGFGNQILGGNGVNVVDVMSVNPIIQTLEDRKVIMLTVTDGKITRNVALQLEGNSPEVRVNVPSNFRDFNFFTSVKQNIPPDILFYLPPGTRIGLYGGPALEYFNSSRPYFIDTSGPFLFIN